jgi:hypothetical protein
MLLSAMTQTSQNFEKKKFYTKLNSKIKEYTYWKKKQPEAMREKFYTTNLPPEAKR